MNTNYQIGDIVLANYLTFKEEIKIGMFLIYALDKKSFSDPYQTFSVLKISTDAGSFQLRLDSKYYKFLNHDSFINANTSQKIGVTQIKQKLGSVNSYTMSIVKKQLKHCMHGIYDELDKFIAEDHESTLVYNINPNNQNNQITGDSVISIDGQSISLQNLASLINNFKS